ncbi:MAG TPA: hypothetical protein VN923_02975 [Thermoanaerobaculia bacterium]|nr:hypothetical protein [Thermoanaerobaculia bacterium]
MSGRVSARALLAGALLLALAAQTVRAWYRIESSVLVHVVQTRMAALGGARPPAIVLRAAEAALRQAHRRDPAAIEPLAFRGDLLFVAGRLAEAENAYRAAAAHELRPETLFGWGMMLWRSGHEEEGAALIWRAVALAPFLNRQLPPGAEELSPKTSQLPMPPSLLAAPTPSPAPR